MNEKENIFQHIKPKEGKTPDMVYFENLAKGITSQNQAPIKPLFKRTSTWLGAAAAVAILVVCIPFITSQQTSSTEHILSELNTIPKEVLISYVDTHIDDFETSEIIDVINDASLPTVKEVSLDLTVEQNFFDQVDAEDVELYFLMEGIDSQEIEEEDLFI